MTPISKLMLILLAAFLFLTEGSFAAMDSNAFELVPTGDPTYGQLRQLENGGLLPAGSSNGPLTRFDVAEKVWDAQQKLKEIVVAQADMDLVPPPPAEGVPAAAPAAASPAIAIPSEPAAQPAPAAAQPTPATAQTTPADDRPFWQNPQKIQAAEQALQSLQQTYDLELQLMKDQKTDLTDQLSQAESDEYNLWKQVKSINTNPSVSIHGTGRAFSFFQQYYGSNAYSIFSNQSVGDYVGYLDLEPTGSISKEITFDGILRLGTYALPAVGATGATGGTPSDYIEFRRITTNFSPDFMTATVGDFYESYTPFTIWNRNNLDLVYVPEQVGRWDDIQKYESFFNHEPDWPFRGLKIGTALDWPDSRLLESFKVSTFANMINNAFNDAAQNSSYYGTATDLFTGWVWGAEAELKSKKMYLGETSWQATFDDYLVVLDNPWGTQDPTLPPTLVYSSIAPSTWAHQYIISSFKPTLKIGLGRDVYIGLQEENAISTYQDNILNSKTQTSDWASNIEPYLQMGDSKITVHLLNVGPYFYSPAAQTRQDNNSLTPSYTPNTSFSPGVNGYIPGFSLFQTGVRSQFFLQNVPSANSIFGYYDRTMDNTFPYGLATPNREGVGMDLDIETLKKKSLKIKGSAYLVQEIIGNYVVNNAGTGYTTLDPTSNGSAPLRNFTYINFGPSFDLGPNIGLETPLEIGTNMRYEQTTSVVGTLNSMGIWGEIRVGIVKEWEVDLALGAQSANGIEEGINGTPMARYSYVFESGPASDLGSYKAFTVNDSVGYYLLSTSFRFDRNSTVYLDYDLTSGNELATVGQISGTLQNQFIGLTYEVKF